MRQQDLEFFRIMGMWLFTFVAGVTVVTVATMVAVWLFAD